MPRTPSPKRTNWKREANKWRDRVETMALEFSAERAKATFYETQCEAAVNRAKSAETQVEQLVGDIKAVSQDYTDAIAKLRAAESRIAELEAERDGPTYKCEQCGQSFVFTHRVRLCSAECAKLFLNHETPTLWQRFKAWRQG